MKNDNTGKVAIIFPQNGRIMDRLSAMALLVKVTELGSMSAAARALNMPLTTVSRHIGELESALGVRLLARTTRKLTLTDAGVDYVAAARRILEEVENAERQATGEYQEPKGELVISAPTMFGRQHVLPVISEFIARYPLIRVRLLLSDRNADLVSDHVDLAVRIGDLADSSMVATRLGTMRIVACAHPALLAKYGEPQRPRDLAALAKYGEPQRPRDLAALPIIRIESPMPYRGWRFRAAEREDQLINLPPVLSVTTPESAADAARLGVGVARLLHYQALDGLRHGELRLLLENVEPDPAPVHLLYTARDLAPLKLRKFIDFAAPALRQALLRIAGAA
ncbi:LysR family transcriptional regulator [Klebsiella pneumoniae]